MINAVMIGDNNVDIYYDEMVVYPGGSCLNAAAFARICGHGASFVSVVGNDRLGELQLQSLQSLGVDVSGSHIVDAQTAWCWIRLVDGERTFGQHDRGARKTRDLSPEDVAGAQRDDVDLLYTCTDAYFAPGAFERLGGTGIPVACDFTDNWTREKLDRLCPHLDYVFLSCQHLSVAETEALLEHCMRLGPRLAVGTRGMEGSIACNGRRFFRQEAVPVEVVDTLGAGDSFITCFILTYLENKRVLDASVGPLGWDENHPQVRAGLDKLVEASLCQAALFAARTCRFMGAFGHGIPYDHSMIGRSRVDFSKFERDRWDD